MKTSEEMTECKKTKFINEATAYLYIKKYKETSRRDTIPVRAYLCDQCLVWHVTSRSDYFESLAKKYKYQVRIKKLHIIRLEERIKELKSKIRFQ